MAIVYIHRNEINSEVFYVGIGKNDNRAYSKKSRNAFWNSYVAKHKYTIEITHRDLLWEEACAIERYLIYFYGRRDLKFGTLVNMTDGGDGIQNFNLDVLQKISNSLKGKKRSIESIEKTRLKNKGKKRTVDFCLAQKERLKGKNNPMYGKKNERLKEMNKFKIGENNPRAKAVVQYDLNNNYIAEYKTAKIAQELTGVIRSGICQACKGLNKTSGGYIWKYKH